MNIQKITKLVILSSALGSSLITNADTIRDIQNSLIDSQDIKDIRELLQIAVAKSELKKILETKGLYNKVNASLYVNSLEASDIVKLKNFFGRDTGYPYLGRVLSDDGIHKSHEVISWAKLQESVEAATGTITWGTSARNINELGQTVNKLITNYPKDLEGKRSSSSKVIRSIILRNLADDKFGLLSYKELMDRLYKLSSERNWIDIYEGIDETSLEDLLEEDEGGMPATLSPHAIAWARSIDHSRTTIAWAMDANIESATGTIAWASAAEHTLPGDLSNIERDVQSELERIRNQINGPLINVIDERN